MTTDYDKHLLLYHLDDPLRILKWTVDEAMIIIVPLFFGMAISHVLIGVFISWAGYKLLRQAKRKFGSGRLKHVMYWYLPSTGKLKATPPSHIREYVG